MKRDEESKQSIFGEEEKIKETHLEIVLFVKKNLIHFFQLNNYNKLPM